MSQLPLIHDLPPELTFADATDRLAHLPGFLALHSARLLSENPSRPAPPLGRYSFIAADPFETVVLPVDAKTPLVRIQALLDQFRVPTIPDLPPFQGGLAGLFSYDLNRSFESIPASRIDEFNLPAIALGAYDVVLAWDHQRSRGWLISQGFPETDPSRRFRRAEERAEMFMGILNDPVFETVEPASQSSIEPAAVVPLNHPRWPQLSSNFSAGDYLSTLDRCIEYIRAGDVFQINLAQRLLHPVTRSSISLFHRMNERNPAPFSAFFDLSKICSADAQIISASPERLLTVRDRNVETRPIKGTRRRTGRPMLDLRESDRLLASQKDRAENTMIVDLMRNDLSPVCDDDSIRVTQLCQLEPYERVLHLVSAVEGRMRESADLTELLAAVFPGGSITGAPKIRAMEIIAELEPTARGAYCGSIGYLGFDGSADLSILIRTITACGGWWQIPVGGGIVAQSIPRSEYEETWTKADGMLHSL